MLQDVLGYEQVRSGEVLGDVADLKLDLVFLVLLADGLDEIGGDVDPEVTHVAPVNRFREAPVPAARIDDRLDGVLLDEVFDVDAILLRNLQGRSRAARSHARGVLAPISLRINAIEAVGQELSVDDIDREVAKRQRSGQAEGNGDRLLHRVSPWFVATLPHSPAFKNPRYLRLRGFRALGLAQNVIKRFHALAPFKPELRHVAGESVG